MEALDWPLFIGIGGVFIGVISLYWHSFTNSFYWSVKRLQHLYVGDNIYEKVLEMGGRIPYIALTGNVIPDDSPILGKYNSDVQGVVRNLITKEHTSTWNPATKSWKEDAKLVSSEWESTPYHLSPIADQKNQNSNSRNCTRNRVHVKETRRASNPLKLTTVSDNFTQAEQQGVMSRLGNYFSGETVVGTRRVEDILVQNTTCTIVGELQLKGDRLIILPPSHPYLRYYFFTKSSKNCVEKILDNENLVLNDNWKYGAIYCFAVAILFITTWILRCCEKYDGLTGFVINESWNIFVYFHVWLLVVFILYGYLDNDNGVKSPHKSSVSAVTVGPESVSADARDWLGVEDEDTFAVGNGRVRSSESSDDQEPSLCSICLERPRKVVFLPCGHVCSCSDCGGHVRQCPICRRSIKTRSLVYFS